MKLYINRQSYQNGKNAVYPEVVEIHGVDQLLDAVHFDHVSAEYQGSHRSIQNFIKSDCLMLDVDNAPAKGQPDIPQSEWADLDKIKSDLSDVEFFAVTSRNHMKEKDGRPPRPKYHLYFPLPQIDDAALVGAIKEDVTDQLPYCDRNATDAARMFFGNRAAQAWYFPGTRSIFDYIVTTKPPKKAPPASKSHTAARDNRGLYDMREVLQAIDPGKLDYSTWIKTGMALHRLENQGQNVSFYTWDEWSARDTTPDHYHGSKELYRHWVSFKNDSSGVGARFLIELAKEHGWTPPPREKRRKKDPMQALVPISQKDKSLLDPLIELSPRETFSWDDKGAGRLFARLFSSKHRWNSTAKEWFVYDGTRWKMDPGGMEALTSAKELSDAWVVYAVKFGVEPETGDNPYLVYVTRYGQLRNRKTMLEDARSESYFSQEQLDENTDLFNMRNGTFELSTGIFREHRADDLLSKISNVTYNPGAKSELFERFLSEVMMGDQSKIDYLQKIIGYSLTADTSLETCWILYGSSTRNGKSTLCETLSYMLGGADGYAMSMPPETLAQRKNKDTRNASGDIARLNGCRFLNCSEPPKRMLFDVALLKTLLGRDKITARHLYEREFEFYPQFSLFINTNFLPLISDDTLFTSGRLNVIEFPRHFEAHEQDKQLKQKLTTEENISGIFNWGYQGLLRFRKEGADPPDAVKDATEEPGRQR